MLLPDFLLHITDQSERIAGELRTAILKKVVDRIAIRLQRGDEDIFTSRDKWQLKALEDAGLLADDVQKEIAKRTGLELKAIKDAYKDAFNRSIDYDDKTFEAVGIQPVDPRKSPKYLRYMERAYKASQGTFENLTRTTADASQQLFRRELDKAYHQVTNGNVSLDEAYKEAVNAIAKDGLYITYTKTDKNGKKTVHRDTIETATMRALRTGIAQATAEITLARMIENNWGIVLVSAHLGARNRGDIPENHEMWQGKFYSIDWNAMRAIKPDFFKRFGWLKSIRLRLSRPDKNYPDFIENTGYGTGEGLCGWNCRHSFAPGDGKHNPFKEIDTEENARVYELSQQQRKMEREIRKQKRVVDVLQQALKQDPDNKALKEDLKREKERLARQNKAYKDFCKDNNLKESATRTFVAENSNKGLNKEYNDYEYKVGYHDKSNKTYQQTAIDAYNMLPEAHKKLLKDVKIKLTNDGMNKYDHVNDIVKLKENCTVESAIHELGHALAERLKIYDDKTYRELVENAFFDNLTGYSIKTIKKKIKGKEVTISYLNFESDVFVSDYQGRLYTKSTDITEAMDEILQNGEINLRAMPEYFSDGYKMYIIDENKLIEKDVDLYNYIKETTHD